MIGEHTDYNGGYVFPGAIDKGVTAELKPNGTDKVRAYSIDMKDYVEFGLQEEDAPRTSWARYIFGVCREMIKRGVEVKGFNTAFAGDVPLGAGMSSSAALESTYAYALNDMFGNINWNDADNVQRQILAIPEMVSKDKKYQNAMKNSDAQEARTESERALQAVIFSIMADNMELFKQFQDNPSFKKWLSDLVFNLTYNPEGKEYVMPGAEQKSVTYDFNPQQDLMMVAEDPAPYGEKKDDD